MGGIRPRGAGGVAWVVLVVVLLAAAAAAAVAKLPAAPVWGLVAAAAVVALALPVANAVRAELERRGKDQVETRRGTAGAVSSGLVRDQGAGELRVHPAIREDVDYIERDREPEVIERIRMDRRVLIVGPSMSGKTRLALSAAKAAAADYIFHEPADGKSLHEQLAKDAQFDRVLVWLDDLERFIGSGGLTAADLAALVEHRTVTIVATIRSSEFDGLQPTGDVKPPGWDALAWFRDAIWLTKWSDTELSRLAETRIGSQVLTEARLYGLSGYLGGAPLVDNELKIGAVEHPAGYAVVQACVDWRRAGIERPLPREALEEVFGCYTTPRHARTLPEQVDDALDWALRSLNHTVALVTDEGTGYRALDVVMDRLAATPTPPPELWAKALALGTPDEFLIIGYQAFQLNETAMARAAWERSAATGNTTAAFHLGFLLANLLDPPDPVEARFWYEKAAQGGEILAMNNLGNLLIYRTTPPDVAEARRWYEKGVAAGDSKAMLNLGKLLADHLDPAQPSEAERLWKEAAEAGEVEAMVRLGALCADDPSRNAEAREWWERAAAAGEPVAMFHLGLLAAKSDTPQLAQARRWYTEAAEEGLPEAMVNLGNLLIYEITPPEVSAGRRWLERAAEAGQPRATVGLARLLMQSDPPQVDAALEWLRNGVSGGDVYAMHALGTALAFRTEPAQLEEGRIWLERAAVGGLIEAMNNLGNLLGFEVDPPQLSEARRWLERAIDGGHAFAHNSLEDVLAMKCEQDEADTDDAAAMRKLGIHLTSTDSPEFRHGLPADERGMMWLRIADLLGDLEAGELLKAAGQQDAAPDEDDDSSKARLEALFEHGIYVDPGTTAPELLDGLTVVSANFATGEARLVRLRADGEGLVTEVEHIDLDTQDDDHETTTQQEIDG